MEPIGFYHMEELPHCLEKSQIRCCGAVLWVDKQDKFFSMGVSDSTKTVEATLYADRKVYEHLGVPRRGGSVVVMGIPLIKEFTGSVLYKIKLTHYIEITFEEEAVLMGRIIEERRERIMFKDKFPQILKMLDKKYRDKISQGKEIEIRSLILTTLFLTLTNNPDLKSYSFTAKMIAKHHLSKSFKEFNELSEAFFLELLKKNTAFLSESKVIEHKQRPEEEEAFYSIRRDFYERLILDVQDCIRDRGREGAKIQNISAACNRSRNALMPQNYLFDEKLIQKLLGELIAENKIYKNSDKLLFINY